MRYVIHMLIVCFVYGCSTGPGSTSWIEQEDDWGVTPTRELSNSVRGDTPTTIPDGHVVRTHDLNRMLQGSNKPVLINVLYPESKYSIRGSIWLAEAGIPEYSRDWMIQDGLAIHLQELTSHDQNRQIVFYCADAGCWLSYNAALRAIRLGYRNVIWYRGGISTWRNMGGPTVPTGSNKWKGVHVSRESFNEAVDPNMKLIEEILDKVRDEIKR